MTNFSTSRPPKNTNTLQAWREKNINFLTRIISIAAVIAYIANWAANYASLDILTLVGYTVILVSLLFAAYYPRLSPKVRATILAIIIFIVGIQSALDFSTAGDSRAWFFLAIFLATVFVGRRAGIIFSVAFLLIWALVAYLFNAHIIPSPTFSPIANTLWVGTAISAAIVAVIITLTTSNLLSSLNKAIEHNFSLMETAERQNITLKEQHDIAEKRSKTLEAFANISQELAIFTDYDTIIDRVPVLFNNTLRLSMSSVFLFDAEDALYQASRQKRASQAQNTRESLSSKENQLLNRAISDKKAYAETNLNPDDENQVYLAIPMQGQEKTIGALFLESNDLQAFGAERISVLQMLANHIAVLLENAILLAQKESALETERRAYGEIAQRAWREFIAEQSYGSYRRDSAGLSHMPSETYTPQEEKAETEAVPIKVRGKIIGHIDARKAKNRVWTAAEKELLSILASRLETAIDSARLYQEAQERAKREEIIAKTSSRVRENLDIEKVLKTAVQELRRNLDIDKSEIWLYENYEGEEKENNA